MTTQTRHYIELSDIVAFRFDCKRCGASLTIPLTEKREKLALGNCPSCGATWTLREGLAYDRIVEEFREKLKRMQEITAVGYKDALGFSIVLETRPES